MKTQRQTGPTRSCLLFFAIAMAAGTAATGETFSRESWNRVLQEFVDDRGRVDYRGLARDRTDLDTYVARVESVGPRSRPDLFPSRAEALAYYINAYNALVFRAVIERGPEEESVWSGFISGYSFFVKMKVTVDGESMSLKKLEDDIVRAEFEDPRIHAALNCASVGCPRLPREAYDPARLDEQLDASMREFVNEERNVAIDEAGRIVTLSKIFDWFAEDFESFEKRQGTDKPTVLDYINRYRAEDARVPRGYKVKFFKYDKRINKQ